MMELVLNTRIGYTQKEIKSRDSVVLNKKVGQKLME